MPRWIKLGNLRPGDARLLLIRMRMKLPAGPRCPHCQFQVFNRRYPKCERCGATLPETITYSAAERAALLRKEQDDTLVREAEQRRKQGGSAADFGWSSSGGTGDAWGGSYDGSDGGGGGGGGGD